MPTRGKIIITDYVPSIVCTVFVLAGAGFFIYGLVELTQSARGFD